MPELPEVETIIRGLRPNLVGSVILEARVEWARSLAQPAPAQFCEAIANQRVMSIDRRGKFLVIRLERQFMLVHLRMSGDLRLEATQASPQPHDRVILYLSGERQLVFNDPRKFGRIWLVDTPEVILDKLGPEPFDPQLTGQRFHDMLQKRTRILKPLLLDQTFLAGLGNIYTDEALHLAKIHPESASDSLNLSHARGLLKAIRAVLQEGIQRNGASIDWVYRGGDFQNHFRVYQRTGQPCPDCGTFIERIVVGQRGTHVCTRCQTLYKR